MGVFLDLTGQRFGRLVAIARDIDRTEHGTYWICNCDCGNQVSVFIGNLRSGRTVSCGCYNREIATGETNGNYKHGLSTTRLFHIWCGMKTRCGNPHYPIYMHVDICPEWKDDFQVFYDWAMSHGYREDLTIDRIDGKKGYSPDNCRWADQRMQTNNISTNRIVHNGQTLANYCRDRNLSYSPIELRLSRGWDEQRALTQPLRQRTYYYGKLLTEWCRQYGFQFEILRGYIRYGLTFDEAILKYLRRFNLPESILDEIRNNEKDESDDRI